MANYVGQIGEFDPAKEDWTHYAERVGHFFTANGITVEGTQRALLLTTIGPAAYKLLRNLVAPAKLEDQSYKILVDTMRRHQSPTPSEIVQRYKFNSRFRREGESIATFLSELRALAEFCNFGPSLDDMLRDRLVCGVEDPPIQRRLLAEEKLTFEKAAGVALAMETAAHNAETLRSAAGKVGDATLQTSPSSVHQVQAAASAQAPSKSGSCYRCGQTSHMAAQCKFKEAKCYQCGKMGHIKRACRQRMMSSEQGKVKHLQEISTPPEEYEYLFQVGGDTKCKPFEIEVEVEGQPLKMEIDTGASVSVVSQTVYRELLHEKRLEKTTVQLKTYGGESLKVLGEISVKVRQGGKEALLPLLVVRGSGPSLFGRNWLSQFQLDWKEIHSLQQTALSQLLEKYAAIFEPGLGTLEGVEAKIIMDPQAQPKFHKARSVPYAMRGLVDKELERLAREGIIEPVPFSDWAAPIVPVLKSDKTSVRICGDFKVTINQASKLESYPIPKIEDLFASLAGGQTFSKIDLSQAYQQIPLAEESKKVAVINTQKGLFQYNRLPFGVSSAPAIFQRTMESLLQDIPHVVVYLDDILVTGTTQEGHLSALEKVLSRLEKAGLRVQKSKCVFMSTEVIYLGHKINAEGLHPIAEKIEAVQAAPAPTNVTELKSYLGLLSYYGKFLPNMSTLLAPLYQLLKVTVRWKWTKVEQEAFVNSKKLLSSYPVLVHFDPQCEVILACDASPYGIGAVLSHRMPDGTERPVGFASRTLSTTEQKYSQIEKEGLACVFGVKRFHTYLYGRHFTLLTDHKPLLGLFDERRPVPTQASGRIQRWALVLGMYEYRLGFRSSQSHGNADALSRLPLPQAPEWVPEPPEVVLMMEHLEESPVSARDIRRETRLDPLLSRVLQFVLSGWPEVCATTELKPFWTRRMELSVQQECILWGNRVVVPGSLRSQVLSELHDSHPGISRMKALGRMFVWWPGLDQEVEEVVRQCTECQSTRAAPPQAPLQPWVWPSRPWSRLHMDYAGPYLGHRFLVVIDAYSKWLEVFPMSSTTTAATVEKLRVLFAQFGLPEVMVSDNGPNLVSSEFKEFLHRNGVKQVTSAPAHPASNGLAERAVKTFKEGLSKMKSGTIGDRLSRFLFTYRNTPHSTTGVSPAELLLGRRLRSPLDLLKPDLAGRVAEKQVLQKAKHDKHAREREIRVGDAVFAKNFGRGQTWVPAVVMAKTGPVSFEVDVLSSGLCWRRHQDQLRLRYCQATSTPAPAIEAVPLPEHLDGGEDELVKLGDPGHAEEDSTPATESVGTPVSPATGTPVTRRYPVRDRQPPQRYSS